MTKRKKALIAAACLLPIFVLLCFRTDTPEPRYEGRTLSQWLHAHQLPAGPGGPDPTIDAQQAIQQIGTNALPTLLRWISYDPSKFRTTVLRVSAKLPDAMVPRFLLRPRERVSDACFAFAILGPRASPAIPSLVNLAITSRSQDRGADCAHALNSIGPLALPALISVATSTNAPSHARFYAIAHIPTCCTNATIVIPTLLRLLSDSDEFVAAAAASVLGSSFAPQSHPTVVPALALNLRSTNETLRALSAYALGNYRQLATSVVPLLKPMLLDASQFVRQYATNALQQIAPEALTNAPAQ